MLVRPSRIAAGALVLALPLAAVAGCGVEKKRTIKAELASAQDHLSSAKALSFSLSLQDKNGKLAQAPESASDKKALKTVLGGKITVTIDPTGARTLADLGGKSDCAAAGTKASTTDIAASLKKVNLSIVVSDAASDLGELRLVNGALYAHVDLKEIGVIAKDNGVDDFDQSLNDAVDSADPKFSQALTDARDGKWLTLDLAKYATKFEDLAKSFTESYQDQAGITDLSKACTQLKTTGTDMFTAVKPFIKVTDANNSSSQRVLDVNVQVRPALKAALKVVQGAKDLPFAKLLADVSPTDIDDNIADGKAHGTITLKDSHLTQVAIDIDSIRRLDPTETDSKKDLAGSLVVLDINDQAAALTAPSDVSTFDVGAIVDSFLDAIQQGADGAASSDGTDTLGG